MTENENQQHLLSQTVGARPIGYLTRYEETDEDTGAPTGRSIVFSDVDFEPLTYSDLLSRRLNQPQSIALKWKRACVLESSIPEVEAGMRTSCWNMKLDSPYSAKTIGLVRGGWLPSGVALNSDMVLLPDRCTISEMVGRFENGAKRDNTSSDFVDLFLNQRIRVNPLLFALEGNSRTHPTPEMVESQINEAYAKIRRSLPLAELFPDKRGGIKGVVGLIQDTRQGIERKQAFLMDVAPKISSPVSANRRNALWDAVLCDADTHGVPHLSLVVFAALSTVAVPNGRSPAKKLLKLSTQPFTRADAYNALSDLRALEILMCCFALFPNEKVLLCTQDKDLALFWSGIRAFDFVWKAGGLRFRISPVDELLGGAVPSRLTAYLESGMT